MNVERQMYVEAMQLRLLSGKPVIPYDLWVNDEKTTLPEDENFQEECGDGLTEVDMERFTVDFNKVFGEKSV